MGWGPRRRRTGGHGGPRGRDVGVGGVRVLGALRRQAGVGGVVRMWVADGGLGGPPGGAAGGAVLRGRFMVADRLSRGAASPLAVRPGVGVKGPGGLLGGLQHPLRHRQVRGADVGSRQGPLVPGRLGAAVPSHVTGLGSVVAGLVPASRLVLVPVSGFSVSVRGRRGSGPWSVPVGPAGLLAPGLLLGPALDPIVPLRRTGPMLTLAGFTSALVV